MHPRSLRRRVLIATWFIRIVLSLSARLQIFGRVKVTDRAWVPPQGRVIIAANHISIADPVFLFGSLRRPVAFLAAAGLFRVPLLGWILRWMGHIPVHRGTSASAQAADFGIQVLEQDGVVVIFPEGKCSRNGQLLPAKRGMADMACRTGALVVPVGLVGTNRVMPLGKRLPRLLRRVRITYGRPITPPPATASREEQAAFTNTVMAAIAKLSQQPAPPAA